MKKIVKGVSIVSFALLLFACGKKTTNSTTNKTTSKKNNTKLTTDVTKVNSTATKITTSVGKCIVSFDSKGGSNVDSQEIKKGEKIERPTDPKMEGYTFSDWYYNDEKWSFDNVIDSNITLEARWTINSYTLTLNTNSELGSVTGANTYEYNSDVTIKATPKEGFSFDGWYKDGEKTSYTQEQTFKMPSSDLTLEARWTINSYTLTLNTNSEQGSVTGANTYEYNSDVTIKATPKEGFLFDGWYKDGEKTSYTQEQTFKMPSKNITLEARYNDIFIYDSNNSTKIIGLRNKSLTELIIPKGVTEIGSGAFNNYEDLSRITIPNSVTSIENSAFEGCSHLLDVFYNGTIEDWLNITFNDSSSTPMLYAHWFYILDINGDNKHNGNSYSTLNELVIPETVTRIGSHAFHNIRQLSSVKIPNSVTSIGDSAFEGCWSLKSMIISDSVTSVGENAFYFYSDLEKVFYEGSSFLDFVYFIGYIDDESRDKATFYCYSETKPENGGNYWHYVDGKPTTW